MVYIEIETGDLCKVISDTVIEITDNNEEERKILYEHAGGTKYVKNANQFEQQYLAIEDTDYKKLMSPKGPITRKL